MSHANKKGLKCVGGVTISTTTNLMGLLKMQTKNLITIKILPQCDLLLNPITVETVIYWKISQSKTYISPFTCYLQHCFCNRKMKRPHLTCLTCKILSWVNGKLPQFTPIVIRQIWDIQPKTTLQSFLFKKSLSVSECLS